MKGIQVHAEGGFVLRVIGSDEDAALIRAAALVASVPFVLQRSAADSLEPALGRDMDVAVIGAADKPLSVAREMRLASPHVQVVFLVPGDRLDRFRASLPFVPNLASAWTADSASDPASLAAVLSDAAAMSRRSADSAAVLGRINQRLASNSRGAADVRHSQLALSERYLATILTQSPDAFVAVDGTGAVVAFNDAAVALFGTQLNAGTLTGSELILEEDGRGLREAIGRSAAGETLFGIAVRLRSPSGEIRHAELSLAPIHDEKGAVATVSITARDVSERKAAEERQRLLIGELNHRVKNTLAIVRGLAQQSFKDHLPTAEQRETFAARLDALAAAHDLLTERYWKAATLGDVVRSTLHACGADGERTEVAGPPVALPPQAAVSMTMALHELCTNAIKYGAYSRAAGRVRVRWTVDDRPGGQCFRIEWRETGGPAVRPPERRGFGLMMLERGLAGSLNGTVNVDFADNGVVCRIEAPIPALDD